MKRQLKTAKPLIPVAAKSRSMSKLKTYALVSYVLLTGGVFFFVQAQDDLSIYPALMSLARGVAYLFPVVENTHFCATLNAQRYLFMALLVPSIHVVMLILAASTVVTMRREGKISSSKLNSFREVFSFLITIPFGALLYWYQFFSLGIPRSGAPASTSFLCMNLGVTWLFFSGLSIFSIGIPCAVAVTSWLTMRSAAQFFKRIFVDRIRGG